MFGFYEYRPNSEPRPLGRSSTTRHPGGKLSFVPRLLPGKRQGGFIVVQWPVNNRYGLLIYAVIASSCFCLLAYLSVGSPAGVVFNLFINLTNTAGFTSWAVSCIVGMRFRKACMAPRRYSILSVTFPTLGSMDLLGLLRLPTTDEWLHGILSWSIHCQWTPQHIPGIPIFLLRWIGHKLTLGRKEPRLYKPVVVDLSFNMRQVEADAEIWQCAEAAWREGRKAKGKGALKRASAIWECLRKRMLRILLTCVCLECHSSKVWRNYILIALVRLIDYTMTAARDSSYVPYLDITRL